MPVAVLSHDGPASAVSFANLQDDAHPQAGQALDYQGGVAAPTTRATPVADPFLNA